VEVCIIGANTELAEHREQRENIEKVKSVTERNRSKIKTNISIEA
jgi:hypothetical protein